VQQLETLTREARALANNEVVPGSPEAEVARQLQICNGCRYCEGFCAVFPAMTRRLEFNAADVHYLANLCHNCGACLHACQYAPPHEFAINVPQAMAKALPIIAPTKRPPINPGPVVAAIPYKFSGARPASSRHAVIRGPRTSPWERAANSGTTPA
jgi:ferredoxin